MEKHKFISDFHNACQKCGKGKRNSLHYLKCEVCGTEKEDVSVRACGYSYEINNTKVMERICDSCEHEHLMDI